MFGRSVVRAEERSSGALAEDEIEIEPNESADPHVLARPLIDRHHGFDADLDPFPDPDRSEVRGTGRPTALAAIESRTQVQLDQRHHAIEWHGDIEIRHGRNQVRNAVPDDTTPGEHVRVTYLVAAAADRP